MSRIRKTTRRAAGFVLAAFLLTFLAPSSFAKERGGANLPSPLWIYASAKSPAKLLDSLEKLADSLVEKNGIEEMKKWSDGAKALRALVDLDAIFAGPDTGVQFAAVFSPWMFPEIAFLFHGVDIEALVDSAARAGLRIEFSDGVAKLPLNLGIMKIMGMGTLTLADEGNGRVLALTSERTRAGFLSLLESWRPDHPEGADVRVMADLARVKSLAGWDLFTPKPLDLSLDYIRDFIDPDGVRKRVNLREWLLPTFERYRALVLEPERLELLLDIGDDAVRLTLSLAGSGGGAVADFAGRYSGAEKREYELLKAVRHDTLFVAASNNAHGTLLPEGPFLGELMADAADLVFPRAADAVHLARHCFADNLPEERVTSLSFRDGGPRVVDHFLVPDPDRFVSGILAGIGALNDMAPPIQEGAGRIARPILKVDEGRYAFSAFRRIAPDTSLLPLPYYSPGKIGYPAIYLTTNNSVATLVASQTASAEMLTNEVIAAEYGLHPSVSGNEQVMALMNGLERREIAQAVLKPVELFFRLYPGLDAEAIRHPDLTADSFVAEFQAENKYAAIGLGASDGMAAAELLLPYDTLGCLYRLGSFVAPGADEGFEMRIRRRAKTLEKQRSYSIEKRYARARETAAFENLWPEDE